MKRLLWKELREKWIWLAALVASTSGLVLFGDGYMFIGHSQTGWTALSMLVALCLGASAYSGELAGGAADFVRSRPVSWKKLLLAKLIVGVGFVLVAVITAALVFRLVCPVEYLRFADPLHLMERALGIVVVMGLTYLCGVLVSVALPGVIGSLFVMVIVYMAAALEVSLSDQLGVKPAVLWSVYFMFVGAAVAVVLISRFGTTLPASVRLTRYLSIVGIFMLIGLPLDRYLEFDPFSLPRTVRSWNLSPNGKFAALDRTQYRLGDTKGSYRSYLVRIFDGRKARTYRPKDSLASISSCWADGTFAVTSDLQEGHPTILWMGRMDTSGRLRHFSVPFQHSESSSVFLTPSPGGKYIMLMTWINSNNDQRVTFVDVPNLRMLRQTIEGNDMEERWWQSDTLVGYNTRGARQFVSVTE